MSQEILGQRAVVIGGSIAGLLSAKALSPFYREILIYDKDTLNVYPNNRKMTPQSHHVHIVLKAGEDGLNQLLPGFTDRMLSTGSTSIDMTQEMVSCSALGIAPKWKAGIQLLSQSRSLLEHSLYQYITKECSNLSFHQKSIDGFHHDASTNQIKGVMVKGESGLETIPADLVVDASGRGALGLRWLKKLGLELPLTDELRVMVGYASCCVRLKEDPARNWKGVECGGPMPDHKIAGMLMPIEDGMHICSVTSRFDDFPPTEPNAFRDYLNKFPHKFFAEALEGAEIVSPIQKMRYESSKFRRYDKLNNLPSGYIPLGDALCSVNPCYGQGMSSAVLQAIALLKALNHTQQEVRADSNSSMLQRNYFNEAIPVCERIWKNGCLKDLRYPQVQQSRNFLSEEELEHYKELEKASIINPELRLQLMRLNHLLDNPSVLNTGKYQAIVQERMAQQTIPA